VVFIGNWLISEPTFLGFEIVGSSTPNSITFWGGFHRKLAHLGTDFFGFLSQGNLCRKSLWIYYKNRQEVMFSCTLVNLGKTLRANNRKIATGVKDNSARFCCERALKIPPHPHHNEFRGLLLFAISLWWGGGGNYKISLPLIETLALRQTRLDTRRAGPIRGRLRVLLINFNNNMNRDVHSPFRSGRNLPVKWLLRGRMVVWCSSPSGCHATR
jgi:hypothetical protein